MQLLTLMDVGTQSGDPLSVDGIKFTEKPFFPFKNHCDLSMDQRTNLFENPPFPQNHQVEEYSWSEITIYKSSASTRPLPSALIGKTHLFFVIVYLPFMLYFSISKGYRLQKVCWFRRTRYCKISAT